MIPARVLRTRASQVDWARVLRADRTGGLALCAGTVAALVWANWPGSTSYEQVWGAVPTWSSSVGLHLSARDWVDQGLLLGFFLLIGLEIRREVTAGELRSWRRAAVPILSAFGGMLLPAVIYVLVTAGSAGSPGWGIPMATDVAFALGALALAGARSGTRMRVFLMTLAVADDVGSIVVLVFFYSAGIHLPWLWAALALLAAMVWIRLTTEGRAGLVAVLGMAAWVALLYAGIEAAVAGVAIGALAPAALHRRAGRRPPEAGHTGPPVVEPVPAGGARRWELQLGPVVNLVVLPVFALANAGLALTGSGLGSGAALQVFVAVLVARLVGKPVGIVVVKRLSAHLLTAGYDDGVTGRGLRGLGATATIGFTIPLLVIHNVFPDGPLSAGATAGLLAASVLGWSAGALLLRGTPAATAT